MAIKYDPGYNAEIRRVVKNFNQKRNRAYAKGFRNLPDIIKVSDLKARYEVRSDLNKELKLLKSFSSGGRSVLERIENQGGATTTNWEMKYLKLNTKKAKEYFIKRYQMIASKVGRFPGEKMNLDNLAQKISILDMDLKYMNQQQFRSYKATIEEYLGTPAKRRGGYRGFLSEVLGVMRMVGIEEKSINRIMRKINELTPDQFHQMYETSSLVSRIYELADSPIYTGGLKLNTSESYAKDLIDSFVNEVDDLVEAAKQEVVLEEYNPLNELAKSIGKRPEAVQPKLSKQNKIPKSTLTKKDIEDLKALGWDDLIDETQ